MTDELRAAVAVGVLDAEESFRSLLQSIVEVARAIFAARASTIFLYDDETDELVFAAVSGEGSGELVGMRLPSSTGIAGWVLASRQPLVLDDVRSDPRWSETTAEKLGYLPQGMMTVPLLVDEEALGVLQVLDRQTQFSLAEMELLGLFASQAAIALHLMRATRRARAALDGSNEELAVVARLAAAVEALEGTRREAGIRMLAELEHILTPPKR